MKPTRPGGLDPTGTAQKLAAPGMKAEGRPLPPFPRELRARLADHDLGDEALFLAWELTSWVSLPPAEARALLLLVLASLLSARQGSTRLELAQPEPFFALGGTEAERAQAVALLGSPPLAPLVGKPGDYKPLIIDPGDGRDGGWLYHQRMIEAEDGLVRLLGARLAPPAGPPAGLAGDAAAIEAAVADVLERPTVTRGKPARLSAEQARAVRTALSSRLTVISGGPGTGKTSIVVSILRALQRLGLPPAEVALAAPTGKAAFRMRESIERSLKAIADPAPADVALVSPEARTLHRLLGYSPKLGRFAHHENNRLAERVVIVDEGSMVDLHLMEHLVRAVRADAALILLGDADQLPSVEAGAVFRDLQPCVPGAVQLTESYRMDPADPAGRAILLFARALQRGQPFDEPGLVDERGGAAEVAFERVELLAPEARGAFLDRWWAERVRGHAGFDALAGRLWRLDALEPAQAEELGELFAHFERARLLTATRGASSSTGAAHVNELLHRRAAQAARALGRDDRGAFLPGEPVMMQHNDYDRGLFNGDQGLVLRVATPEHPRAGQPMVVFPRQGAHAGVVAFHLESLRPALALSYAITIHKSQGSELDHVALLLPDEDLPLVTRELLYTGVTRARRSVVLVGQRALVAAGAARQVRRFSGIAQKLGPAPKPPAPQGPPPSTPAAGKPASRQLKLPF